MLTPKSGTINAVACIRCGQLHAVGAQTYIAVAGNIYVGAEGGIVGNNLNVETNQVENIAVFCFGNASKPSCLEISLAQARERVVVVESRTVPISKVHADDLLYGNVVTYKGEKIEDVDHRGRGTYRVTFNGGGRSQDMHGSTLVEVSKEK